MPTPCLRKGLCHLRTFTASTETAYGYDELGRLQHVYRVTVNGDSGGISVTGWDDAAQEPVFAGGTPDVTTYTYDDVGNLDTVTLPNGVVSDYGYDALNRLTGLLVTQGDGDKLFEQAFTLEADGQRDFVIEKRYDGTSATPFSEVKIDWTYDALNRLTAEDRDGDPTPGNGSANFGTQEGDDYTDTYAFDLAGP